VSFYNIFICVWIEEADDRCCSCSTIKIKLLLPLVYIFLSSVAVDFKHADSWTSSKTTVSLNVKTSTSSLVGCMNSAQNTVSVYCILYNIIKPFLTK